MNSPQASPVQNYPLLPLNPLPPPFDLAALVALMRQMAHDMRGPLGTLSGTSELFAQGAYGELTPQQTRANDRIRRSAARMVGLLDDLMLYVKAQTGQLPLVPKSFDPRMLLDTLCKHTTPEAAAKTLRMHWTTAGDVPPLLMGDAALIRQMVLALVTNAIAFTESGDVWIDSGWEGEQWVITVRDSGPGIPPEEQSRVFEPFYRGEQRPQMASSGFGLGLSVVTALAGLMHGQIALEKSDSTGSTFVLRLSIAADRTRSNHEAGSS